MRTYTERLTMTQTVPGGKPLIRKDWEDVPVIGYIVEGDHLRPVRAWTLYRASVGPDDEAAVQEVIDTNHAKIEEAT